MTAMNSDVFRALAAADVFLIESVPHTPVDRGTGGDGRAVGNEPCGTAPLAWTNVLTELAPEVRAILAADGIENRTDFAFSYDALDLAAYLQERDSSIEDKVAQATVEAHAKIREDEEAMMLRDCTGSVAASPPSIAGQQSIVGMTSLEGATSKRVRGINLHGSTKKPRTVPVSPKPFKSDDVEEPGPSDSRRFWQSSRTLARPAPAHCLGPRSCTSPRFARPSSKLTLVACGQLSPLKRLDRFRSKPALCGEPADADTLGAFLSKVGDGGPTAASGVWHHLDWWRAKIGICLDTRAAYIEEYKTPEVGHMPKQAPALPPTTFQKLLLLERQGVPGDFFRLVLLAAVGCIRLTHMQRSKYIRADEHFLWFFCALGKSRRGGVRNAMCWEA